MSQSIEYFISNFFCIFSSYIFPLPNFIQNNVIDSFMNFLKRNRQTLFNLKEYYNTKMQQDIRQ